METHPTSEGRAATPDGRLRLWISVALAVLTVLVYLPVRAHEFVSFDDQAYVRMNPHVQQGLTWDTVRWAFTTGHAGNWHPLTWLSHALDVSLFGMDAGAHHLVNLALHVANTLLLLDVLRRLTGSLGRSAFVAALFAVHPLHVESVAWVAERKDVLSTLFWLLTTEAYVAWVRRPAAGRYALVVLALAAGLMAKQMLVTLPFTLLLLDWWPLGRWTDARAAKRLVVEKLPLFALVAAASVVVFVVQRDAGAVVGFESHPIGDRVASAFISYVLYVKRTFVPTGLTAIYVQERPLPAWKGVAAAAALVVVTLLAVRGAKRRPWLLVGWLWFLGTLVPVIGLVQVGLQSMADRYTYVPLVGLFVVVAWGAAELLHAVRSPKPAAALAVVATLALAVVARRQVEVWKDSESLWRHAVAAEPDNAAAHNYLGDHLCWLERWDEAVAEFSQFVRISPESARARNNLGYALTKSGRPADGATQLAEAVRLDPSLPDAHANLGLALEGMGRLDDARREYAEAVRLDPEHHAARAGLERLTGRGR